MKIKTILTIFLTAIITVALFQNSEPIAMKFLWVNFEISKLILILGVFIIGLIVGLLWAAGFKSKALPEPSSEVIEKSDEEWLN